MLSGQPAIKTAQSLRRKLKNLLQITFKKPGSNPRLFVLPVPAALRIVGAAFRQAVSLPASQGCGRCPDFWRLMELIAGTAPASAVFYFAVLLLNEISIYPGLTGYPQNLYPAVCKAEKPFSANDPGFGSRLDPDGQRVYEK